MDPSPTRPSWFIRLRADEPQPREIAWGEFSLRYAPVIRGFARAMGCKARAADEVANDVISAFFEASSCFDYDPAKGRFRGYLKTATWRHVQKRLAQSPPHADVNAIDPADPHVDQAWDTEWDQQLLRRALESVRDHYQSNLTWQAFDAVTFRDLTPEQAATQLNMSIDSVYKAKQRITTAVRQTLLKLQEDEG
jgi:RNA polymerase sigma factor (sigma-70 family)